MRTFRCPLSPPAVLPKSLRVHIETTMLQVYRGGFSEPLAFTSHMLPRGAGACVVKVLWLRVLCSRGAMMMLPLLTGHSKFVDGGRWDFISPAPPNHKDARRAVLGCPRTHARKELCIQINQKLPEFEKVILSADSAQAQPSGIRRPSQAKLPQAEPNAQTKAEPN